MVLRRDSIYKAEFQVAVTSRKVALSKFAFSSLLSITYVGGISFQVGDTEIDFQLTISITTKFRRRIITN